MKIAVANKILFTGKQNIPWNDVEQYLKQYIKKSFIISETKDVINIHSDFPDEYCESRYTKSLRGAAAKAKANAVIVLPEIIANAYNRRWVENKSDKHENKADGGWYRYDAAFSIPVLDSGISSTRHNIYKCTLIVRIYRGTLMLYDIINIKKEASTPP